MSSAGNYEDPLVKKARAFALEAHGDQMYGTKPYEYHLQRVADLCSPMGPQYVALAWLHDVVEDTAASFRDVEEAFDDGIAWMVGVVTDQAHPERGERKRLTYKALAALPKELPLWGEIDFPYCLAVKVADRLANIRHCASHPSSKKLLKMYRQEHPEFEAAIRRPGWCDPWWEEMRDLLKTSEPPTHAENEARRDRFSARAIVE